MSKEVRKGLVTMSRALGEIELHTIEQIRRETLDLPDSPTASLQPIGHGSVGFGE